MTGFRKFTDQTQYAGEPSAKLYKHGQLGFNMHAGREWFDGVETVCIYVHDSKPQVAIEPTYPGASDGYSYSEESEYGGHVAFRSVLSQFRIDHEDIDESIAVDAWRDEETGRVVVDLSEVKRRWG